VGVVVPGRPAEPTTPLIRELLRLCDGTREPARLADDVGAVVGRQVTLAEVMSELDGMCRRRWIVWRVEVPASAHPDRHLRETLDRVTDPVVRDRALAGLAVLERARDRIRAAHHDADRLADAMAALETDFAALTSTTAQRSKNARTAPCRALVYSDARRSATVRLGTAVLDELTPLALCLTAARWMTNRFADVVGERIRAAYHRLHVRTGRVDLGSLWFECLPVPHPEATRDIDRIQAELRAHWQRIIDAPAGARRVQLSSADIADRVRETFDEPGRGWSIARYISPDVIILAEDAESVERGDFQLVLGELHVAMNTVGASLFVMQHPDAGELIDETSRDFPGPRVMPMLPKEQPPRWSTRSRPALVRPEDYLVALVDHTVDPRRPRTVLSADVSVVERDDRLVVVLPDGAEFDVLDVFGNALTNRVMDRFTLRADADHSPRVTVDRMVVARESWRFVAGE
ncbi:lantibiotic dehydratase, partial [Micromonospora echinofusca]